MPSALCVCSSSARLSTLQPRPTARAAQRSSGFRRRCVTVTKAAGGEGGTRREAWDILRFARTVLFFNPPPRLSDLATAPLRALTSMLAGAPTVGGAGVLLNLDGTLLKEEGLGDVVLIAGATGGVGSRVARLLLSQGVRVRVVTRDIQRARQALGKADSEHPGLLEVSLGDVTQPQTLGGAQLGRRVRGVVTAFATKVQPKEGDNEARDKYRQGIKFYDPEVVGDTPETVEAQGMAHVLSCLAPALMSSTTLLDAGDVVAVRRWSCLDDVVMGGASASQLQVEPGAGEGGAPAAVFSGRISTANNGGFASVRNLNWEPPMDCGGATGLALRLLGDGQRYKLFIRTDPGWDAIAYGVSFDTPKGQWATVHLPFASFKPIFRAQTVNNAPPLDARSVRSLQLMLSKFEYDRQLNPSFAGDGPFRLPISRISTYSAGGGTTASAAMSRSPLWVHVSSAGVTRPHRPGIDVNAEPPAVRMNEALGNLLDWKLAGEDLLRASGVPFAIVRPVALTEEPAGAELQVDQGDTIKGKISRDDVAQLCVALLAQTAAVNVTFEIKSTVPFSTPWTGVGGVENRDWAGLLRSLRPGVTGKTIGGVYSGTRPEAEMGK